MNEHVPVSAAPERETFLDRLADFFGGNDRDNSRGSDIRYTSSGTYDRPQVVAAENQQELAPYEIEGPTEDENYDFRGTLAPALIYRVVFEDGVSIPIVLPKEGTEGGLHQHTLEEAAEAAAGMPLSTREDLTKIVLSPVRNPDDSFWEDEYDIENFRSYMTGSSTGEITIYPSTRPHSTESLNANILHEGGHIWSYDAWGTNKTRGGWNRWRQVMEYDSQSLSTYADSSIAEDVAETVQAYNATFGTPQHDEYRRLVPNRFALLDREYAPDAMLIDPEGPETRFV